MDDNQIETGTAPKQAAILFADVSGWTELCSRVGDAHAKRTIDGLLLQLTAIVQQQKGWVVKTIGDELMCVFDAPDEAVYAACAMQRCAEERNRHAEEKLFLRIGFHCGPVLIEDNDVFGDTVNMAARVTNEAFRERILTTRNAADRFSEEAAKLVHPWRSAALKGKEAKVQLVEVTWRQAASSKTVTAPIPHKAIAQARRVMLLYQGKRWVLDRGGKSIKFGRGEANDLVVHDPTVLVSSSHGQIEFLGDVAQVVDTSLNGIYIAFDGEQFFRMEKRLILRASGFMTLGRPPSDELAISIEFKVH